MIKETIENIKRKIEEKKTHREDMAKVYPVDYLFLGYSDKEVCEKGISYSYRHTDCFLVNNDCFPTAVLCLTGNNCNLHNPIKCYTKPVPLYNGGVKIIYCVDINGQLYEIDMKYNSYRKATNAEKVCIANVQSFVDAVNYDASRNSMNRALDAAKVKSEFSK